MLLWGTISYVRDLGAMENFSPRNGVMRPKIINSFSDTLGQDSAFSGSNIFDILL